MNFTPKHCCAQVFDSPAPFIYDKGRYHILSMNRGLDENLIQNATRADDADASDTELLDIDPADFVDPDEFRNRHS